MILSKSCLYAIRASLYLASQDDRGFVPIMEIAARLKISFHFLTKIFQLLTQKGIMKSFRGPRGGISLAKPAEKIMLLDIITAVDGNEVFKGCILGLPGCGEQKPCPLHEKWATQREDIARLFGNTSLGELASKIRSNDLRLVNGDLAAPSLTRAGTATSKRSDSPDNIK